MKIKVMKAMFIEEEVEINDPVFTKFVNTEGPSQALVTCACEAVSECVGMPFGEENATFEQPNYICAVYDAETGECLLEY